MAKAKIYAFADEASPMIDEQIQAVLKNGLDGLEIRNVDNVNVSDITTDKAKEVRKKLDAAGLVTWSIGSPIGKIKLDTDDFKAHTEKFKHTLEIANILGAANIRLFSFYIPQGKKAEDYKDEVISRLGMFVDIAANSDIRLCHENEKGIYGDNAARCADILKALPQLGGIFDPANFVQCGQDTLEAWSLLKPRTNYMHIKDALADGNVVPAGKGCGNVAKIVRDFRAAGGCDFTIEPHLTVFSGLSGLEQEGEQSRVGEKYVFESNQAAFCAACNAFKSVLQEE